MDQLEEELIRVMHKFHKLRAIDCVSGISRGKMLLVGSAWHILQCNPDHKVRVSDIVSRLDMPAPGVSRILKGLEEDGILERSVDPEDRRSTLVTFTEKGLTEIRRIEEQREKALHEIIRRMGEEKVRALCMLLDELYVNTESVYSECRASGKEDKT